LVNFPEGHSLIYELGNGVNNEWNLDSIWQDSHYEIPRAIISSNGKASVVEISYLEKISN